MNPSELEALSRLCAASGREAAVRDYICAEIEQIGLHPTCDRMGNVLVSKQGATRAKHKLLLTAHMDEVAMMVTAIHKDGTLAVGMVGGISTAAVVGRQVRVGRAGICGVMGTKPVHHLDADARGKAIRPTELAVDIGAENQAEAQQHVRLGDVVYFPPAYQPFGDGCIAAKALDDRFGCTLLLELLRSDLPYDTEFAFLVQEEVGLRGAQVAANAIQPELAIIFEATTAADVAGCNNADAVCRLGSGAVISYMDGHTIYDAQLYDLAVETAEHAGIPWQTKTKIAGGNDAGSIQSAAGGVRVLAISVPCRYLHSPLCVIRESDANACIDLAKAMIPAVQQMELHP